MLMAHLSIRHDEDDRNDNDGSYSDDFDGEMESELVASESLTCSPGAPYDSISKNQDDKSSTSDVVLGAARPSVINPIRRAKNDKGIAKPLNSAASNPRTNTLELSRQYGSVNLQDRLAQTLKRLKHEQKENSRLRDALVQIQRTDKNLDVDNERADLNRQLKEYKSEIKTLKTELRRYEAAQAEYQQTAADQPERIRSLSRELRQSKEKYNELMLQHREDERQIRSQHDKICTLQKQLQSYTHNAKKGSVKSDIERERETWQGTEKEYRRIITDLKSALQKEQRRNRRTSTSMKNMRDQFESEIIRLGNLLKQKERKLSTSASKFSIPGQRERALSRSDAMRHSLTSREGNQDLDVLSQSSDIAHELQTSLEQIKSAFPSKSGCDPTNESTQLHDQDNEAEEYEEDFD